MGSRNFFRSLLSVGIAASLLTSLPQTHASSNPIINVEGLETSEVFVDRDESSEDLSFICGKELRLFQYIETRNGEDFIRYKIQLGNFNISYFGSEFIDTYVQIRPNARIRWSSEDGASESGWYHLVSRRLNVVRAETLESVFERGEESYLGKLIRYLPDGRRHLVSIIFNWPDRNSQAFFYNTVGIHYSQNEIEDIVDGFEYLNELHIQNKAAVGCSATL